MFSFTNFEANYDADTGTFGISTSVFGKKTGGANEELLLEQLQLSQNLIDVIVQNRLDEQDLRQRDDFNQLVSAIIMEMDNRDYLVRQDLDRVGYSLQAFYEVNDRRFEDVKDLVFQDVMLALQTVEIKK